MTFSSPDLVFLETLILLGSYLMLIVNLYKHVCYHSLKYFVVTFKVHPDLPQIPNINKTEVSLRL